MATQSVSEHHPVDSTLIEWLQEATEVSSNDEGWALLAEVGSLMVQWHSDFDSRTYGFRKLSSLLVSTGRFEISNRSPEHGKSDAVYARYLSS